MPIHPRFKMPSLYNPDMLTNPQTGGYLGAGQAPEDPLTPANQDTPVTPDQPPESQGNNNQIMQYLLNRQRMADTTSPSTMQDQTPFRKPLSLNVDLGEQTHPLLQKYSQPDYSVGAGFLPTQDPNFGMGLGVDLYGGESQPEAPTMATPQPSGQMRIEPPGEAPGATSSPETAPYMLQQGNTDRESRREMLAALAEAAGRVGNVGGVAQKTTAYDFADRLGKAESGDSNVNKQMNLFKLNEMQRANEMKVQNKDPNSQVSKTKVYMYNKYYKKYGELPANASGEVVDQYLPYAAKMLDKDMGMLGQESYLTVKGKLDADALERANAGKANFQERELDFKKGESDRNRSAAEQARADKIAADAAAAEAARQAREAQARDNQKFQQGQNESNNDFRLRLQREAAAERLRLEREKQAQEAKERQGKEAEINAGLVVPGYRLTGQVKPTQAEAVAMRKALGARNDFVRHANEMKALLKKAGSNVLPMSQVGSMITTVVGKLKFDIKNLEELGAIQAPDVPLLMSQIPDPTSMGPIDMAKNFMSGSQAMIDKVDYIIKDANAKTENQFATKGYVKDTGAAPPAAGSTAPAPTSGRKVWRSGQ